MDEILIEEKKYISSKRAAKITGYAKDYIGQLCREGRVPARLIGRSWYVLESAIQDHRFGDQNLSSNEVTKPLPPSSPLPSTWEVPRYEASPAEVLPSINRLRNTDDKKNVATDEEKKDPGVLQHLQDSWRPWFNPIADTEPVIMIPEELKENEESFETDHIDGINVPIHAIYQPPPEELLPKSIVKGYQKNNKVQERPAQQEERRGNRVISKIVQIIGVLLAVGTATLAILNYGYFDTYLLSIKQVQVITGISVYNK